ncbi:MAG TPA: methionyl-tRNA formyltransferase [Accumulibacter sp.]|uniref:Methionyl-tRNA formyltransferase n=2 Tax=Candidatus Accumulibacter TaxID=327159 RepID=A0A080MA92_9PROT|nr:MULTISPECIES: methionyl-tRNA formyltransferase [Candidatus Accumulibacter]KFB77365.1 MAG: Methionyl-tRNA formyltransferase [Candidatus Accumulibacter cognatus]MBL8401501.1 methionyl-tRNA formyltransferase [Accumulibacter sp.]MCC2866868.1 methionyl-tRNA formyltransferase [Candidatus Accumulibacter phosphatis]MCQ1549497.1 methionyl-tRNA formyltransferase [Candidatus Accumulibacter phosphatis]QLH49818.1 MAG: methionyl-tRNA formyltransferase [Candidatus Accumulibacter cognatus]
MKLVFAGTPEFAALSLQAIIAAGHQVVLVLTQPDRAAGRGLALHASPVKQLAEASGIEVFQPPTLRDALVQERIRTAEAEAIVVAAYGLIFPQAVLDMPRFGCINIHASLLPRWRGAAPVQRALLAGDQETGVCIMQMDAGLDSGPVLLSARQPINEDDTASSLQHRLAEQGALLIVEALACLPLQAQSQPQAGITYAAKINKAESALDWRLPAIQLERQVRAFNPVPGASCCFDGNLLKVWRAELVDGVGLPGEILAVQRRGIVVACGEGALRLVELQKAGGKRLTAAQFLAGTPVVPGSRCALSMP